MKQIIPFKKELLFKTKVSEITSISLEHTLTLKENDLVSGEFYITGDYKMTEGSIHREKFSFQLPFDIALDSRYDTSSMVIDIDNFYYEVINNETLQVNIDVYVEGEKLEEKEEILEEEQLEYKEPVKEENTDIEFIRGDGEGSEELEDQKNNSMDTGEEKLEKEVIEEREEEYNPEIDTSIQFQAPPVIHMEEEDNSITNQEFHIFENVDHSDTYVTYHVYIVKEDDTLEKIMEKYSVTKEELILYNNIEDIKPGVKLIIPN